MKIDSNPFFRRTITPWYDSEMSCWILITFMLTVLIFGLIGVKAALENGDFESHIWVPSSLVALSFFTIVSTAFRMIRRHEKS
ncbi:MAG: hypothetical protein HQK66_00700 [Desulfamplus sp.]|nr:hypothetical protein [Desulfamplus sp.]